MKTFGFLILVAATVNGQYSNMTTSSNSSSTTLGSSNSSSNSLSFANPTGVSTTYATKSLNYSLASTYLAQTDFSNERLALLWDQVGPISTGSLTTTIVTPTPEPSKYASPGRLHPYIPSYEANLSSAQLPSNFLWGVASSAYQIEGAADAEGKGPSIWDLLSHRVPNFVADNTTGDVAASHYYRYKQDIARLESLGIPAFSISISWPRIFPFGKGPINEAGVSHYDDVIADLVAAGIDPVVTLFHWDTPLALFNEYGGWTDRQIVDDFFNYATYIIQRYDKYVKHWFTINEPQYCNFQYKSYPAGKYYPAYHNITGGPAAEFACGHFTLLAHAKVAKWYHEDFKGQGRISFKNSGNYFEANSTSAADQVALQRGYDFSLGWFNNPVWNSGDYPTSLRDTLGDLLPTFTEDEKTLVKGSCDFFAIDGYTSYNAYALTDYESCLANSSSTNFPLCAGQEQIASDGFPLGPASDTGASWLVDAPVGIRKLLKDITVQYPSVPDVVVSEFGFAEPGEGQLDSLGTILWDLRRADYFQSYLDNILASIVYDGVNVTGAFAWAIYDNYEWSSGYSTRFGLQYTNYTSLEQTPKASMFTFLNWFKQHGSEEAGGSGNYSIPSRKLL